MCIRDRDMILSMRSVIIGAGPLFPPSPDFVTDRWACAINAFMSSFEGLNCVYNFEFHYKVYTLIELNIYCIVF